MESAQDEKELVKSKKLSVSGCGWDLEEAEMGDAVFDV